MVPPGFDPIGTPVKVTNNIISGNDIPMITELGGWSHVVLPIEIIIIINFYVSSTWDHSKHFTIHPLADLLLPAVFRGHGVNG